jgi:hypothetical protein
VLAILAIVAFGVGLTIHWLFIVAGSSRAGSAAVAAL